METGILTITFLADRANFLAGGGDMVLLLLVPSAVVLLLLPLVSPCGLTLAVFCSSARCERSTLLAGDDRPLEAFLGVEGVSPTGALFGQTESWIQREKRQVAAMLQPTSKSDLQFPPNCADPDWLLDWFTQG